MYQLYYGILEILSNKYLGVHFRGFLQFNKKRTHRINCKSLNLLLGDPKGRRTHGMYVPEIIGE